MIHLTPRTWLASRSHWRTRTYPVDLSQSTTNSQGSACPDTSRCSCATTLKSEDFIFTSSSHPSEQGRLSKPHLLKSTLAVNWQWGVPDCSRAVVRPLVQTKIRLASAVISFAAHLDCLEWLVPEVTRTGHTFSVVWPWKSIDGQIFWFAIMPCKYSGPWHAVAG
jgi:hypothetical protein